MLLPKDFKYHLESFLNNTIIESHTLSGGDTSSVFKIETSSKEFAILKLGTNKTSNNLLNAELNGLRCIANSKTIHTPVIYSYGSYNELPYLFMEYVPSKRPNKEDFSRLGQQLAQLHKHSSESFGLESPNYIGRLKQQNNQTDSWIDFYSEYRLGIQFQLALNNGLLKASEIPTIASVKSYLESICHSIKPSLLHGDLWSGNYLIATDGTPYLIDPSVYYGHSEIDIAMSKLFGGFDASFYEAYHGEFPITEHFQTRIEIYQLYYLLVHLNMFGSSYYTSVKQILNKHF